MAQTYEMRFAIPNYLLQIPLRPQNLNPKLQKFIACCVNFFYYGSTKSHETIQRNVSLAVLAPNISYLEQPRSYPKHGQLNFVFDASEAALG